MRVEAGGQSDGGSYEAAKLQSFQKQEVTSDLWSETVSQGRSPEELGPCSHETPLPDTESFILFTDHKGHNGVCAAEQTDFPYWIIIFYTTTGGGT